LPQAEGVLLMKKTIPNPINKPIATPSLPYILVNKRRLPEITQDALNALEKVPALPALPKNTCYAYGTINWITCPNGLGFSCGTCQQTRKQEE
jgi:hypothetical protein